ncbi:MAG: hypothetical protein CVV41_21785 [Candidatus Riflebacteria bacterium HGW-Riflebacteria-1]|jgi:hypothetical protein|nr:MAG: hypothetical protein CVV41_21785 [Candidatus Riflebacteria bacterium HGW-Riflebacteria-1]
MKTEIVLQAIKANRALAKFVNALLDRVDRQGKPPAVFSLKAADCPDAFAIQLFFGHAYIKTDVSGRVSLNLSRYLAGQPEALDRFYAALNRRPRNLREENDDLLARLSSLIDGFAGADTHAVFAAYLADEREKMQSGRGELYALAENSGCPAVTKYLENLRRGITAIYADETPLRLSHFSRAVTGDTKSCRAGTALLRKFADLLYSYDPAIKNEVDLLEPVGSEQRQRAVLDQTRLQIDSSATRILVFGSLVFSKGGRQFAYVAEHARLGEPAVLTQAQFAGAVVERAPQKLVSIENETSFYDYVEQADSSRELVVCSMGQANRLLIRLLKSLKGHAGELVHWGDLDRSGVLILDSLRRRTGLDIRPLHMDPETFGRHRSLALPLAGSERDLIASLLQRRPQIICADLLKSIINANAWLEQENIPPAAG